MTNVLALPAKPPVTIIGAGVIGGGSGPDFPPPFCSLTPSRTARIAVFFPRTRQIDKFPKSIRKRPFSEIIGSGSSARRSRYTACL